MTDSNTRDEVVETLTENDQFEAAAETFAKERTIAVSGELSGYEVSKLNELGYSLAFTHNDRLIFS